MTVLHEDIARLERLVTLIQIKAAFLPRIDSARSITTTNKPLALAAHRQSHSPAIWKRKYRPFEQR